MFGVCIIPKFLNSILFSKGAEWGLKRSDLIRRCIMKEGFLLTKEHVLQQTEKKKKKKKKATKATSSRPSENALTFDIASWKISTTSTFGQDKFKVNELEEDVGAGDPFRMTHIQSNTPGGSFTIKINGGKVTMIPTEELES